MLCKPTSYNTAEQETEKKSKYLPLLESNEMNKY